MADNYDSPLARAVSRRIGDPVATEAAVADIPPSQSINKRTVLALAELTQWAYVAASVSAAGANVIIPTDARTPGRWHKVNGTLASAVAALAAAGTYTCLSGDAVGDFVYVSAASTVAKADADDTGKLPCIGVITSKPTATSAVVQTTGEVTLSGLTAGAIYYLSGTAGSITATPVSSHAVPIGVAKSTTVLVLLNSVFGAGNATVRGVLNVVGAATITGALTASSTLDVTGAITGSSTGRVTALGVGTAALATGIVSAGPVVIPTFTVAGLPSAVTYARGLVWVSNQNGGATFAISDGTNWKVVALGATAST